MKETGDSGCSARGFMIYYSWKTERFFICMQQILKAGAELLFQDLLP